MDQFLGSRPAVYALLPGASLYYEAVATGDALAYLREFGSTGDQRDGYEILYPAYGTYVGGLITAGPLELAPVLAGHVVGRVESWRIEEPRPADDATLPEPDAAPLPPAARLTHSVSMLMPRDAAFN